MHYYGIRGSYHEWFTSYLNNRTQTCQINCSVSSPKLVKCGVPQGTILGPLLFILYINDLPNCLYFSQPRMYADDTSLTFASALPDLNLISDRLNYDLDRVFIWLSAYKLTLNLTKTEFMLVVSRQKLSQAYHPVCVVGSAFIMDVSVYQISKTKAKI